jgi:galactofuranosylgalactofuranosylrhamnosyl-N-acetylglucosaminyl-diphospho-decaprenol beta-1,5/1,6-galactofuranosyltransferase
VDENEAEAILLNETSGETGPRQITVWAGASPIQNGRIYLRLTALGDVAINDLAWVTDIAPKHNPSLSVGLCTFNREPELAATLAALSSQRVKTPEIKTVYVVNQGPEFSNERILAEIDKPGIALIEQPNLGGCGGFTRSMFEATQAKAETTHHLLMDDDIVLDPRLLDKVVHFLRYAHQTLAVGGQMLEIENPTLLYEAGGRLHPQLFVTPVAQNTEVGRPNALKLFSETPKIDYNAWWFCVLPVAAIQKIGLPPPLFIRGDDIEYGCRLSASGFETIPLPGCPVWHESFSRKDADWMMYYVFRNRIFLTYLHPKVAARRDPLFLIGFLMTLILANRYRSAELALKGIMDGVTSDTSPNDVDSEAIHKALMKYAEHWPKQQVVSKAELGETQPGVLVPLDTSIPAMVKMCVSGSFKSHLNAILRRRSWVVFDQLPQANAVQGRSYASAVDPEGTRYTLFPANLLKMWNLIAKSLFVCVRYAFAGQRKAEQIGAELETLRHPAHWKKAFNAPRD